MKVDVRGKLCLQENVVGMLRGIYLVQPHTIHWHFLKNKGYWSLLDTCPKVPLIDKQSSTPCLSFLYSSRSSLSAKLIEEKGWMESPPALCILKGGGCAGAGILARWNQVMLKVHTVSTGCVARETHPQVVAHFSGKSANSNTSSTANNPGEGPRLVVDCKHSLSLLSEK